MDRAERARALLRQLSPEWMVERNLAAVLRFADEAAREARLEIADHFARRGVPRDGEDVIAQILAIDDREAARLSAAKPEPAPVTYRAGTVPPRIEVGMVLRYGTGDWRVKSLGDRVVMERSQTWVLSHKAMEACRWKLARDWIEPGATKKPEPAGGGACEEPCGAPQCMGDGRAPSCADESGAAECRYCSGPFGPPMIMGENGEPKRACPNCDGWPCAGTGRAGSGGDDA